MSFRLLDFEIWKDPWFDGLSSKGKLLFLFLISSPHNDKCGTQPFAKGLIGYHCGLNPVELESTVEELKEKVSVVSGRIFAHRYLKHQCRTGNFKKGIPDALKILEKTLRERLLAVCGLNPVELGLNPVEPSLNPLTSNKIQVTSNEEQVTLAHETLSKPMFLKEKDTSVLTKPGVSRDEILKTSESTTTETKIITAKNAVKGSEKTVIPESLKTEQFLKTWETWNKHLKEKRKTPTSSALALQLRLCEGLGVEAAIKTIERSIQNNWQGLFPEKETNKKEEFDVMEALRKM